MNADPVKKAAWIAKSNATRLKNKLAKASLSLVIIQ